MPGLPGRHTRSRRVHNALRCLQTRLYDNGTAGIALCGGMLSCNSDTRAIMGFGTVRRTEFLESQILS